MLETLRYITPVIESEAAEVDRRLIRGRVSAVGRNYTQLTDVNRSKKFIERKAGRDERRSATQDAVIWFASTAMEDPGRSALVEALWSPLFRYARPIVLPFSFLDVDEEIGGLLALARRSYIEGNRLEARFNAIKIREKADELIRLCDQIPAMR
jgi:hypothetical protein